MILFLFITLILKNYNIGKIRPLAFQEIVILSYVPFMTRRNFHFYPFVFLFLLFTAVSCEKFSGDQTVPAYLSIDSIYLTTNYYTQGTTSQHITDAWVTIDNEFIGAFELPARFPVLKTGKHSIKIFPGIKKDGIAATRVSYNFYSPVETMIKLAPDSSTRMGTLKTTYTSAALFQWKEDFEEVALTLDTLAGSSAYIQRTPVGSSQTFEGNHSGLVVLDSLHSYFECQTHSAYNIPVQPVFLEMNFNTSCQFTVGVVTYGSSILYQTPVITLNPTNGIWKKIYIDLSTTLNAYTGMTTYRVYMRALKGTGVKNAAILFDNFKLVTLSSAK